MKQRTLQVMQAVRRKIDGRLLEPGEKLPSVRNFAAIMGVSPSTVVEAYDRLVGEGAIHARPRSGFYVAQGNRPLSVVQASQRLDRAIDPVRVSRQFLEAKPGIAMPGCGWLPADWMPVELLSKVLRLAQRRGDDLFSRHPNAKGSENLRGFLSGYLADQGIEAGQEHILLTKSASSATDLICRLFLSPGDRVLVDEPCHYNLLPLLRAHKADVIGVPYASDGPDTGWFEDALQRNKVRLYITSSALQNPTGAIIAPHSAHKVLTLAARNDVIIIEDDTLAGLEPDPLPRLAALDGLDRVIRIGSFSKTLSRSVSCGYIAARRDWIEALTDLQLVTGFGAPDPLTSEVEFRALSDSSYPRHMEALRTRLTQSRQEVSERLATIGIKPWNTPRGGFYLWCALPDSVNSVAMARSASVENVILAPGNLFSPSQNMASFMLFNVSQMDNPGIFSVLERALQARMGEVEQATE